MSNKASLLSFVRRLGALPLIILTMSAVATSVQGCVGETHDEGTTDGQLTDGYGGYGGYDGYGYGGYGGYGY